VHDIRPAELVEHDEAFLGRFDLRPGERQQITKLRPLFAAFWVMRLPPGGNAYHRNPRGTLERQASRLPDQLGPPGEPGRRNATTANTANKCQVS
jgi:hypothetical protein